MAASAQPSGAFIGRLPGALIGIVRRRAIPTRIVRPAPAPIPPAAHEESALLIDGNNYIPTSTADLWRRGKPGR